MTIEQLLEALPIKITTKPLEKNANLVIIKREKDWIIFYSLDLAGLGRIAQLYTHYGKLHNALEAIYQDLKDNNLL